MRKWVYHHPSGTISDYCRGCGCKLRFNQRVALDKLTGVNVCEDCVTQKALRVEEDEQHG